MSECIEFKDYDGRYYPVRANAAVLLTRGWRIRFHWPSAYANRTWRQWLKRLLSATGSWGIEGTDKDPEMRIFRIGPVFIDYLPDRRRLATDLLYMRRMVHAWAEQANEQQARALTAEAKLRELQRRQPSTRGGDA